MPKEKQKKLLDAAKIPDVLESGKIMRASVANFRRVAQNADTPLWLPPSFDAQGRDPRAVAVDALCRMDYDDCQDQPVPPSGILVATPEMVEAADAANQAKDQFQKAVSALRASMADTKACTHRLVEVIAAGPASGEAKRDAQLAKALRNMGFARMDLISCYRRMRVITDPLQTVSYTWQRHNCETTKVSKEQALMMADALDNEEARQHALHTLGQYADDTHFAYRKGDNNQLRANIHIGAQPPFLRKSITVSGVLLVAGELPPRIIWRDLDSHSEPKLPRQDRTVAAEPCVELLHLYEYMDTSRARARA